MQVVGLESSLERKFLDHVNNNPMEYYWYIVDWKYNRADTKINMALEEEEIRGLLLTYGEKIAAVRGNREAVDLLMEHLKVEKVEMSAPKDCEDLVLKRYTGGLKSEIVLMHLEKGQEKILKSCELERLVEKDAEDIVTLLSKSNPGGWWDDLRVQQVVQRMDNTYWVGIRSDDKLVSVGSTRFIDFGTNIGVVATNEAYRNRGYATTIVSALVEEIFKRYSRALIHVLADNGPALRAYQKVGFRPYNSYFMLRNGIRV